MKAEKQLKILIPILIASIIIFTMILIFSKSNETSYTYNGFEVRRISENEFQIKIYLKNDPQPHIIKLRYGPKELENIPIIGDPIPIIQQSEQIYITIDPYANLTGKTTIAALEIDKFIDNKYLINKPVNSAFTKPYGNHTVKTCTDAVNQIIIILLKLGDETKIYLEGNCIIIQGQTESDLIRAADRLALYLIGIMKA